MGACGASGADSAAGAEMLLAAYPSRYTHRMLLSARMRLYRTLERTWVVHLIVRTGGAPPVRPQIGGRSVPCDPLLAGRIGAGVTFCSNVAWCASRRILSIRRRIV